MAVLSVTFFFFFYRFVVVLRLVKQREKKVRRMNTNELYEGPLGQCSSLGVYIAAYFTSFIKKQSIYQ